MAEPADQRRAEEAVAGLPEAEREVLTLATAEGLTVTEISNVLGMTERDVELHLARARMRVSAQLNADGDGDA